MKNIKQSPLKFKSKVLFVFENKNNTVNHNYLTDTTTGTITLTGTGMLLKSLNEIKSITQ